MSTEDLEGRRGERNALVRRSPGAVEKMGTGASSILSRMVSDAIAVARQQEKPVAEARFRIGNYEFRSPDYRQILLWAEALESDPITVVQKLEGASLKLDESQEWTISFRVDNGAIVSLVWDFDIFSLLGLEFVLSGFEFVEGLSIREIAFKGSPLLPIDNISLQLPSLRRLIVRDIKLKALDLSNVPELSILWCYKNELAQLDLSNLPMLVELCCYKNRLTQLDLSTVPKLTRLYCHENKITELDLSNVPELRVLACSDNQLTEFDLSNVLKLIKLYCERIKLTELDLSSVPELTELWCAKNQLTELDLSSVPELTKLYCNDNPITELDLSNVPKLSILWCQRDQLTELDLSRVPKLSELDCRQNQLTELDLSNVPALNDQDGPHCRDYHTGPDDRKRFLKYRACDPLVKMKGVRTW